MMHQKEHADTVNVRIFLRAVIRTPYKTPALGGVPAAENGGGSRFCWTF
jgi:hypothetical protein